ncbi:hypothetical protein JYK22_22505, partial [Nonomuraea sp. RK-328]|nr:hypothetical protein [Nonomuraea sp. RK-328]
VGNAFETHRRSARRSAVESPVEVVTGPAVKLRIRQLVNSVRHEIRRLDRPPHLFGAVNRAEIEQLARGVTYRVVYARESLELPGYLSRHPGDRSPQERRRGRIVEAAAHPTAVPGGADVRQAASTAMRTVPLVGRQSSIAW